MQGIDIENILITFIISFLVSMALIPVIRLYCDRNGVHDYVSKRKIHTGKISRLGGLAIFTGFMSAFIYILYFDFEVAFNKILFVIALSIAFLTGFIDDLYKIRARYKLILQLISGLIVALAGLQVNKITLATGVEIYFGYFSYIITILWVAGFMNAVNLLDGIDGLASGVVMIALLFVAVIGYLQNVLVVKMLCLALVGAILGFFMFNYPPAKIFMGDGGAYFLGFLYAVLPLIGIKKTSSLTIFLIPLILLLIPIIDMLVVTHKRFVNGYNIFIADKNHIHHRLLRIGFSNEGILWLLITYTAILGCFSILMLFLKPLHSIIILVLLILLTLLSFYTVSTAEGQIKKVRCNSNKKPN